MNLIETVKESIEREGLIPSGSQVVVGVSGGADSVALLHVLHQLGYPVIAVHLNHGIRARVADEDQQFVIKLCAELGVQCVTDQLDVPALAKDSGRSLEMAARDARHDLFRSVISGDSSQASILCLAHHADDQLETFFLRAARGSGPTGLGGMKPLQKLDGLLLARPFLGIRRSEIICWLEKHKIRWREDASNRDEAIARNRVRHQILPILGDLNECAAENILRTMEILREEGAGTEDASRRREARDWLIEHGVTPSYAIVQQFVTFAGRTDGSHFLDLEGLRVLNEYGTLRVSEESGPRYPRGIRMEEGAGVLRGAWEASVALDKVTGHEVTIRTPVPGDRMNPYGMEGSKKLQDIFTDLKVPKAQRAGWPVVECHGEIIWVPGYRIARGWDVGSERDRALHLYSELSPIPGHLME